MNSHTPFTDMEAVFWTYLNKQRSYQDLRLKEFRGYDGRFLPYDPTKGLFPSDALPAIYALNAAVGSKQVNEQQVRDKLELKGRLVFAAQQPNPTRAPIERAFATLSDILGTVAAQTSRLDSTIIETYEWKPDSPKPIPDLAQGTPRFWYWDWAIELTGKRHTVIV